MPTKTSRFNRCPTCHRRHKRSHEQNARYWLLLHKIAESIKPAGVSYSPEQWHLYAKSRWLGCDDVALPNGTVIAVPHSSADLPIDEFNTFMEQVEAWAAERQVWLDE